MKLLQDQLNEPNPMKKRINQIIELNEMRDKSYDKVQTDQAKMKNTIDRRIKEDVFQVEDLVLKWDALHEDKGKHGKLDHLWVGPYLITALRGDNAFVLQYPDGSQYEGGPMNGRFQKHYLE